MRFALLLGQSQYGSLRLHMRQLAAALEGLGHEAKLIDLADDADHARLNAALAEAPDAFVAFSGMAAGVTSGGMSAYDRLGCAYVSLYVDHPAHHAERLSVSIRRHVAFFLDRSHVQFVNAWRGGAFAHLGFLPPGANELPEPPDLSDEAFARRRIGVLFTGTYRGAPERPWRAWEPSPARDVVEAVAERMAADGALPVLDALKAVLKELGAELTPSLLNDFVPLLQIAQAFAEAYHRDALLHALGGADVPLQVRGSGWEPLTALYPSFRWGGVGSFEETLELLRDTKVVLNINNGFVAGGHERVFSAMCAGAAVFSDASRFYAEAFKEGREIVTFPWGRLREAPERLMAMLGDESRLAGIARAGAKRAQAEHRWTDRAAKLAKTVKQAG